MMLRNVLVLLVCLGLTARVYSQVVFSDDFDTDSVGDYRVLKFNPDRDGANFAFDYGTLGIPAAPNSDGSTIGLQLWANNPAPNTTNGTSAIQLVPQGVGSSLVDKQYRMSFDIWMNVNGPLPGGGSGSTEAFMAGVGWNGAKAIEIGNTNGSYFTITGEGGSSNDVRTFTTDGFNVDGTIVGPSADTSDPYYTGIFPGGVDVGALPVQGGQDGQTGTTAAGQMAFQWHQVDLDVMGDTAKFYVDDLLIGTSVGSDVEGSVMIGYGDYFDSETDAAQWSFGLVDNLRVEVVPEPSGQLLIGIGFVILMSVRTRIGCHRLML